ncbi:MAG: GAF domain-containing protein [Anaerolineales bacterium]|nr:GAF domain-containing protein [Anaerolineales bacterium]
MSEQPNLTTALEERQRQIGLWAAGIFAALSIVIAGISSYAVAVVQQGRFEFEDAVLVPATILFVVISLLSYSLIRRGRYQLGIELLFILMMALPGVATLVLDNFEVIVAVYIATFAPIMFAWVLPKTAKRLAAFVIAFVILFIVSIEIWDPAFRGTADFAVDIVPAVVVIAAVLLLASLGRLAWKNISYSISNRLTILLMLVTIPLLIGVTLYISNRAGKELEAQTLHNLQQNNQSLGTNVSTWLELNVRSVQEMSMLPDITSMDASRQKPNLQIIASAHPNLFLVQTTDINGKNVARNDNAELNDYHDRAWFLEAKGGAPVAYEVLISRTIGKPALNIAAPIYNGAGKFVGVASMVSELNEISKEVLKNEDNQGITYIVDANNRVVAHPDSTYTEGELRDLSNYPPVAALNEGKTGQITFTDENGIAWIAYVDRLENGWGIIAQQTEAELLAPVREFQTTAALMILAGSIAMFILAWFAIRRSLQPIGELTATASAIATGDLNRMTNVKTQDELGLLASTFNDMTAKLRESFATLEARVAERTRNLELAAEVGRSVSHVRALDVMLTDAAELIRQQFDLYYVQVYLTNTNQTYLNLEAGTGNVGSELLGQNHRLPLNTGSINGRAAIEKKSVVISDTTASGTFKPNPLLPNTRSEMAVPLMIGEKVVGVLDMQSEQSGSLSEDALPAFEALAGQLAIAIQNATFLAETEQARAEVAAQAQRLSRTNWTEYLDAIHMPEKTGFVFEQNKILPMEQPEQTQPSESALSAPIEVTGEALGNLVVEMEGQSPISRTSELVNTVARQVARQIENLRLLDTAERYRAEAEQATRRTTREGWKTYVDNAGDNLGYVYDLKEVRAHNGDHTNEDAGFELPLKVRDERVGKLSVFGLKSDDQESIDLINDVAERLGTHIESLRQFDQTQSALAQSEKLFEASSQLAQATDLQKLVGTVVDSINIPVINRALLLTFNYNTNGDLDGMDVIGNWWNGTGHEATAIGTHYTPEIVRLMPMFVSPVPIFFNDSFNDERVDATTMQLVKRLNLRAVAVLPLHSGTHQIGMLMLESEEPYNFTQSEIRLYTALAPQIATVLENRRQFAKAQQQAERESKLNVISQKIQSATTVEAVLQIAARELGHALGAPMTVAQLSMKDKQ